MIAATARCVFLSYSRTDAEAALAVRARRIEAGATSLVNRTKLTAGQRSRLLLEMELGRSGAIAVFLGLHMSSWQHARFS